MQCIKAARVPAKALLFSLMTAIAVPIPMPAVASEFNLPSLGDTSSSIMSREQEYQLGRAWLSMLRGSVRTLEDPLLKDYIEGHVFGLAETSQLDDRRLTFVAIDSPQLNAFAAPGGIIGVNGGLFLHAHTEAEFASVMAHELAHLSQRHFARGLQHQQQNRIPLMTAMLASVILAASGGGDAGFAALASTQAAAIQEQRRFSRQNEQEADRIGLLNLQQAGFDPNAMPEMFERLAKLSRFSRTPPEFLLTHPVNQSRIADSRNRAGQLSNDGRQDSLYYQMMRARVQLFYEDSPGLAAQRFRALLDEHQGEHAAARYGLALALIRSGQADEAAQELDPLLAQHPDNIAVQLAKVELDSSQGHQNEALTRLDNLLKTRPDSYPLLNAKADILLRQRDYTGAERVTDRLARLRPEDPDVWYLVSEIRGLAKNILGVHQARAEYFMLAGDLDQADQQLDQALKRTDNFVESSRINARKEEVARRREILKGF
ncbi:M48 family metalloprotease [Halopseudomonas bauzanensis]|uniref:Putative beta-barrel assembly-enhancing protease n=2 Tax=Halopseudomonas bauzanensis TaxID=653930 RepID=A0A031MI68_9GAMM|nr:peptidase M48 [Halopseudomonas bauzanensis]SER53251.1 Putative Zn-dependent protease, contains TPR repeats [Halopseudomonas bauzanensis]SFL70080.1 Putative Zn-dependent protease, contains TPR repeats [Halopseudomonas bauzanensis]